MKSTLLFAFFLFTGGFLYAQCNPGQIELYIVLHTDSWAYENYWELVPQGSGCGNNIIAEGANLNVGCTGTASANSANGYDNNSTYTEGPFCLDANVSYDLIFVDSYGDGGLSFDIYENGILTHVYTGSNSGNVWTFTAGTSNVPAYDMPCLALEVIPNGEIVEMNNADAFAVSGEPAPPSGNCAIYGMWCEPNITNTVWAYFVAEEGVAYEISTCASGNEVDTQIALWHSSDCSNWESYELISSNDDMFGGCGVANGYSSLMYASCLIPGETYYIQIDGWAGAVGTIELYVSSYEGITTLSASVNDVNCPFDKVTPPDGSISPYITGSGSDFSSSWTGPQGYTSTDHFISGLGSGNYTLTATTSCGDVFTQVYTINEPTSWNLSASFVQPDCPSSTNGAISISVSGATAPYTYFWMGPDNYSSYDQNITDIQPGAYTINVSDDRGCENQFTYQLADANNISLELGNDTIVCSNSSWVINGPLGFNYAWQDGSNNQFYFINAADWGLGDHSIILSISTDDGCFATDVYQFTVDNCVGIDEDKGLEFTLYPNPNHGDLTIQLNHSDVAIVRVFDALGKEVYRTGTLQNQKVISLQLNVARGVYSATVEQGNAIAKKVFVVE